MESCNGWCLPLVIYIALAFLSIVIALTYDTVSAGYILVNVLFYILIGFLMYQLCKNCQQAWSWFLLLLPFVLIGIFIFLSTSIATGIVVADQYKRIQIKNRLSDLLQN